MNQPFSDVVKEQKNLGEQGYMVIDSYGDDFDTGMIFEKPNNDNKDEVLNRHKKYIHVVAEFRERVKQIVDN
jgi:hypothetical protein